MRTGITPNQMDRLTTPLERARQIALRRTTDVENAAGAVVIWYRNGEKLNTTRLAIQPGVADDLPALLSALAVEIGWPGAPATEQASRAVAVWARVWQVREQADLRLALYWDAGGQFHGTADLQPVTGAARLLAAGVELSTLLDRMAVTPQSSRSPHALLLAGNAAMHAGEYATARAHYTQALADLPRHVEGQRNLSLALARLGEWDEALATMATAVALAPEDAMLGAEYLALETDAGISAVAAGDPEHAAAHFLHILARLPDEPTALANLGNIRLRQHRLREAAALYRRFLRHHPHHPAAATIQLALDEIGEKAR